LGRVRGLAKKETPKRKGKPVFASLLPMKKKVLGEMGN